MLDEKEITRILRLTIGSATHLGTDGWSFRIVDELPNSQYGYTDFDKKVISLSREHWPTLERNIRELINHEVAHALCGHGEHNLEWWDKLIDIGGRGIWVEHEDKIKHIGVVIKY